MVFTSKGQVEDFIRNGNTLENQMVNKIDLSGLTLDNASLIRVLFVDTDLSSGVYKQGVFESVTFNNVTLKNTLFSGVDLTGAIFINCDCEETTFDNCDLSGAMFLVDNKTLSSFFL